MTFARIRVCLTKDPSGKHVKAMGKALALFVHLVGVADWETGAMKTSIPRLAKDMGLYQETIRRWLRILRGDNPMDKKYIDARQTGKGLEIRLKKWSPPDNLRSGRNERSVKSDRPEKRVRSVRNEHSDSAEMNAPCRNDRSPKANNKKPSGADRAEVNDPSDFITDKTHEPRVKKIKKGKPQSSPNPDIKAAVDHFHQEFIRIHGVTPSVNGAHAKILKAELEDVGRPLKDVKAIITGFLTIEDPALEDAGFPINWLPHRAAGILKKNNSTPTVTPEQRAKAEEQTKRAVAAAWGDA